MSKQAESSSNLKKLIGDEQAKKMGNYDEYTGGGHPIPRGETLEDHPELRSKRVMQPRDEEGKFTYNAVNYKKLKYGPSRGKTVPPFLRGLHLNNDLISANGKIITDGKRWNVSGLNMSKAELIDSFKEYRGTEEGFGDFENAKFSGVKGRPSKGEKEIMNSKEAHGYYGDTEVLGAYVSEQDLKDNMKKFRIEKSNRIYRKTLLGIQRKLGESGVNKSIPEIKDMIKSGEVARILGPNYMEDIHKGFIKKRGSNKKESASQTPNTNPESKVDEPVGQENPQGNVGENAGENVGETTQDVPQGNIEETSEEGTQEPVQQDGPVSNSPETKIQKNDTINAINDEPSTAENQGGEVNSEVPSGQSDVNSTRAEETPESGVDNPNGTPNETPNANENVSETPKKSTKNETTFSKEDLQNAKYNSSVFYRKYKNQIDGLTSYAKNLGVDFRVAREIESGKYGSFKDVENAIAEKYKEQNGQYPEAYTGAGSEEIEDQNQQVNENISEEQEKINNRASYNKKFDDSDFEMLNQKQYTEFMNKHQGTLENLIDYSEDTLGGVVEEYLNKPLSPKTIAVLIKINNFKTFNDVKTLFDNIYKKVTGEEPIEDQYKEEYAEETQQVLGELKEKDKIEREREANLKKKEQEGKAKEKALKQKNEELVKKQKELNKQKRKEEKEAAIKQSNEERGLGSNYVNKREVNYDRNFDEQDFNNLKNNVQQFWKDYETSFEDLKNYGINELGLSKETVEPKELIKIMRKHKTNNFGEVKTMLEKYASKKKGGQ